jgi:serine/threonine protein kinase
MQDCGQRLLWRSFPNQAIPQWRRCRHQAGAAGQALQGRSAQAAPKRDHTGADSQQNRELQIMRIVRHPNIVELKAFFYNNGERVRVYKHAPTCNSCD